MDKVKCSAKVSYGDWGRTRRCNRWAKLMWKSKPYCTQHNPKTVAAKKKDKEEKWHAEFNADIAYKKRVALCLSICEGLSDKALKGATVKVTGKTKPILNEGQKQAYRDIISELKAQDFHKNMPKNRQKRIERHLKELGFNKDEIDSEGLYFY